MELNRYAHYVAGVYKFQIKLALSVVIYAILSFFDYPVARKDLEQNSKERMPNVLLTEVVPIDMKAFP